jgi:hypothetical protein
MFHSKTDFKLNSMKGKEYVYQCVLGACAENSIYEINEMLEENGVTPLGVIQIFSKSRRRTKAWQCQNTMN